MTIAELNRYIASYGRRKAEAQKEQAAQNYMLAVLIGRNVASYLSTDIEMPTLEEAYPSLFKEQAEEAKQRKEELITELSVLRFKQFANFHNKKFQE